MTSGVDLPPTSAVGRSMLRLEDPRFLRGLAQYVDDIHLPHMLHAAFARSPVPHARIVGIDTSQAVAAPGVAVVLAGSDLVGVARPLVARMERPESLSVTRNILAVDTVRYVGEPVVAVVASSRAAAEDAAELIEIDYDPLRAVTDAEAALSSDAPLLHGDVPENNSGHIEFEVGDIAATFAESAHVFSSRFYAGRHAAVPLEGRAAIADWDGGLGELTLWSSSQMPHLARVQIAGLLDLAENKVRVIAPAVGGGFGAKSNVAVEEFVTAHLSRLLGRPVKWIADRYEDLASGTHAKEMTIYLDIAVDADANFLGFRGRYIGNSGAYALPFASGLVDPVHAATLLPSLYDIGACRYEVDAPLTNKCWTAPYRGVGMTSGHTARELLIDDIARHLEIDPVELRIGNCIPSHPYRSVVEHELRRRQLRGIDAPRPGTR